MAAPVTKPFIDLTIQEVCLLFADLHIENITGALLATASSKDDLKNPPFSLQINDRSAHRIFGRIQECLIYGVEHEELPVISKLLFQSLLDIILTVLVLLLFRYHQHHQCHQQPQLLPSQPSPTMQRRLFDSTLSSTRNLVDQCSLP